MGERALLFGAVDPLLYHTYGNQPTAICLDGGNPWFHDSSP